MKSKKNAFDTLCFIFCFDSEATVIFLTGIIDNLYTGSSRPWVELQALVLSIFMQQELIFFPRVLKKIQG